MPAKTYLAGLLLAGCLAFGSAQAQAQAQAQDERYTNAHLVNTNADGLSDGLPLVDPYGLKFPEARSNLSLEGEASTTILTPDTSIADNAFELSCYTLAAYAVYTQPISGRFSLYGRGGLQYENVSAKYYHPVLGKVSDSNIDINLGLGFGTKVLLRENLDFTVGLTIIDENINHLSAGGHYRF
jgi:opacity protein-like surface antigen